MSCTTASHEATKSDPIAWASLPLQGLQLVPPGVGPDEPAYYLEIRLCPLCGSSLALPVRESAMSPEESAVYHADDVDIDDADDVNDAGRESAIEHRADIRAGGGW